MKSLYPASEQEKAEIDLTPMLDVVFIMLIFFLVTASFLHETGIPVTVPTGYKVPPDDIESITVIVEPASTFIVNDRVLSKGSLIPYLQALFGQNPEATFAVIVADGSRVKDTVAAADAGHTLGFDVIPIMQQD